MFDGETVTEPWEKLFLSFWMSCHVSVTFCHFCGFCSLQITFKVDVFSDVVGGLGEIF